MFGVKNELISKIEKRTEPVMPDGKPSGSSPGYFITFRVKPGARSGAEADDGGDRGRLKIAAWKACSFFVRRTKNKRIASFGGVQSLTGEQRLIS